MTGFTFQVDRCFLVSREIELCADWGCAGARVRLAPGARVVYRGPLEIDGGSRLVFAHEGRKLYAPEPAAVAGALSELYEEPPHYA